MLKHIAMVAAVFGLAATPVFAAEQQSGSNQPTKLTDSELDQVSGGDPLIYVGIAAPINIHLDPITVNVDIPVNVAAVVQANVLGNANFSAAAVGTQNNFGASLTPGG